jgi:hypothetical protein
LKSLKEGSPGDLDTDWKIIKIGLKENVMRQPIGLEWLIRILHTFEFM